MVLATACDDISMLNIAYLATVLISVPSYAHVSVTICAAIAGGSVWELEPSASAIDLRVTSGWERAGSVWKTRALPFYSI